MKQITISTSGSTRIGRQGENEACEILFPVAGWAELYGVGEFTGFHQRPNDCTAYPVNVTLDNEVVHWVVTASDLEFAGYGEFQLVYTVNGVVAKSVIYKTTIGRSLGITKAVPAPFIPWFNRIIDLLGIGMTAHATTLPAGAEATASYDDSTRVLSLGIPKGADGDDYVLTEEDKEEIAEKTAELVPPYDDTEIREEVAEVKQDLTDLSALVDGKMEFYKVTLEGYPMRFYHEGTALNYADLESKYNDDKFFLYCEYESVTFIPSLPPVEDPLHDEKVLEFTAVWKYSGAMHITSIKINELEQIKVEEFEAVGDVKVNGQSIVVDGIAEIPIATAVSAGVAIPSQGLGVSRDGAIYVNDSTTQQIDSRGSHRAITAQNIDYAVKAAMADGRGAAWTDTEKLAARERIGLGKYELIETITISEEGQRLIARTAEPNGTPYNFSKIAFDVMREPNSTPSWLANVYYGFGESHLWSNYIAAFSINSNSDLFARAEIDVSCGIAIPSISTISFPLGDSVSNKLRKINVDSVTKFCVYFNNNIPVGTTINIYGIRK